MNILFLNSNITQMLAARELKHDLKLSDAECVAVIRMGTKGTKRRFVIKSEGQLQEFGNWHRVYLVPQLMGKNYLFYIINFCVYTLYARAIIFKYTPTKLVFGNYLNEPMRHLANKFIAKMDIIFMDEGLSSINVLYDRDLFFADNRSLRKGMSLSGFIKKIILRFQIDQVKGPISLFSILPLPESSHTRIIPTDFSIFKESIQKREVVEVVYFLGGPFVEWGYVTRSENRVLLKSILDSFAGKKLIYFPHPLEELTELKKLSADLKFEIKAPDQPFELFLSNSSIWPSDIATYFSFGAVSCIKLFGDSMNYHFFELPNNRLKKGARNVANIYAFLKNAFKAKYWECVTFHSLKIE